MTSDLSVSILLVCINTGLTHFLVVRSDLPVGFAAAQVAHAAGESSPGNLSSSTIVVLLAARDEIELKHLADRLESAGVDLVRIHEPDPPWLGSMTAIGVKPVMDRSVVGKLLSYLPLYGKHHTVSPCRCDM